MKRKKKLKTKRIVIALTILGVVIYGAYRGITYINYTKTYEYKLIQVGYINDNKDIIEYLEEEQINKILEMGYDENVAKIIKEKYFLFKNLDKYLAYIDKHADKPLKDVVSIINIGADKEFYTEIKKVDLTIDDPYLILVNKYHVLDKSYAPEEVADVSSMYSYANLKIDSAIYGKFISMWNAAKKENLTLVLTSGYRDYTTQERLYKNYSSTYGKDEAETFSARPGHSEHQLGFALDIVSYGVDLVEEFELTPEFAWLKENAHKYGFILRYPKESEHLTGYIYEPWHYRYVGIEMAEKIKNSGITFDEYYAYYLEK